MAGPTAQEVLDTLKSINAKLGTLLQLYQGSAPKEIATDLDTQYGDPLVRAKDPRDWIGESQIGKSFSECPPEYLDLVASRLDFFAEKAEAEGTLTSTGKPVAPYNRRDAARARGWAARLRSGWTPPAKDASGFPSDAAAPITDDDIPF